MTSPNDGLDELDPAVVADDLAQTLVELYAGAEQRVIAAIARALRAGLEPGGVIEEKAAALAELHDTVQAIVDELTEATPDAVAEMLERAQAAGAQGVLDELAALVGVDQSRLAAIRRALPGGVDAVSALVGRLTGALQETHLQILRYANDAYRQVIAAVAPRALLGTDTLLAVQRAAWDRLVARGVTGFVDRSGRRWNLASYVEMACRATTAQAVTQARLDGFGAAGLDLILVSDAPEECRLCRPWEGKVLARTGPDGPHQVEREHGTRDGEMVTVYVAGSVTEARAAGLLHPNCRHALKAFIPGVTRRYQATADPKGDANRQELRRLERAVRRAKAKEAAALTPADQRAAARRVRTAQAAIRDHIGRTGQLRQRYREQPNLGHGTMAQGRARADYDAQQARTVTTLDGPRRAGDRPADYDTTVDVEPPATRNLDAVDVATLSDDELDEHMQAVMAAERWDLLDEVVVPEMDRRDAERQRAAMTPAERRAADKAAREEAQMAHFEELLNAGWSEEEAVAEAFGISIERQRRDRAISQLRSQNYQGRGFDELARQAYKDHIYTQWHAAEDACRGELLNRAGEAAGIDPISLFSGPQARARKYASDELKEWWENHGRLTYDEFAAQLLGDQGAAEDARYRGSDRGFWQ